jgi:hypothetical protein
MKNLVYLAGPITGLQWEGATGWREWIKKNVPYHIQTISPLRGKQYLEKRSSDDGQILDSYDGYPLSSQKGINARDHWDCTRASLVFVNLIGATRVSIGTVMEIAWAFTHGVPVILCIDPGNIHDHAMIRESANFIVDSVEKGLEVMVAILSTDQEIRDMNTAIELSAKRTLPLLDLPNLDGVHEELRSLEGYKKRALDQYPLKNTHASCNPTPNNNEKAKRETPY